MQVAKTKLALNVEESSENEDAEDDDAAQDDDIKVASDPYTEYS